MTAFLALLPIVANFISTIFQAEAANKAGDAAAVQAATAKLDALQAQMAEHRRTAVQQLLDDLA